MLIGNYYMELNNFDQRNQWGGEAEKLFEKECKAEGIEIASSKLFEGWTPFFDLLYGDFLIDSSIRVDVKRNSISQKSLNKFLGEYYVVYRADLKEGIVLEPGVLKKADLDWEPLKSGDLGVKYSSLQRVVHIDLEDFKTSLKKSHII